MNAGVAFTLSLTMKRDWRIGAGVGRQGSVDSLVIRDHEDFPFAPSSSVAAMWRDAAEQLAHGLHCASVHKGWSDLVDVVFGSHQPAVDPSNPAPWPSRLSLANLRLPEDLREPLRGSDPSRIALRQALTFIKPGVRIDPRSGTAAGDMLRFVEVCRAGSILSGEGTIDVDGADDEQKRTMAAFAFASLRLLERIGGGRRRGLGACKAEVSNVQGTDIRDVESAIQHLKHATEGSNGTRSQWSLPEAPRDAVAFAPVPGAAEEKAPQVVEVPLLLKVRSPLLVMDQRLGNVTTCLDHVPGTMLLPIVTAALCRAGMDEGKVKQSITSGDLAVAPAYPMIGGVRGLPVPMRWRWRKEDATQPVREVSNEPMDGETSDDDTTQKVHPKGGQVVTPANNGADYQARVTEHTTRTHNTVEDRLQKPTEDVGGVYTYESIRAGQELGSVVRLPRGTTEDTLQKFREEIQGPARVGAVLNRGYGEIEITALTDRDVSEAAHHSPCAQGEELMKRAVLWFVSDFCLPAPLGTAFVQGDQHPHLKHQLATALGRAIGRKVHVVRSWSRTRRHESWHRQWGLPRPSLVLVRGGSVVVIEPDNNTLFTCDELVRLERFGAGDRRAEGFGQIRVNAVETTRTCEFRLSTRHVDAGEATAQPDMPNLSGSSKKLARRIEIEAWRAHIRRRAEEVTATPKERELLLGWTKEAPSASQLGKMRGLLNTARTEDDVNPKGWNGTAEKMLRVLNDPFGPLKSQPADAASNPATDGTASGWHSDAPAPLTMDREQVPKNDSLKRYAIAAIVHAALRAHRRDAERSAGDGDEEVQETR